MNEEGEQFILDEDRELMRIRKKKLQSIKGEMERREMSAQPVHLTDLNFEPIINNNFLVLVDFWAPWCGSCQALAPTIDELSREYVGKILIGKLNVDENPQTAERFQIYSIPTLVLIKKGKEMERIIGLAPKSQITAILDKHLR